MNSGRPSTRWPVIAVTDKETVIGRSSSCGVVLPHTSVSGQHARLAPRDGRVEIEDLDSRFGTFVNATQVRRAPLQEGDVVRLGSSPPYRFDGKQLVPDPGRTGMTIAYEGVGVRGDRGEWLLGPINVGIEAGQFTGVLGPSGAGKSLFLETLGTLRPPDAGRIVFDEHHDLTRELDDFRGQLGQVPQQDLIYPWLTAWENVALAARLRLPKATPDDREQRIRTALEHVEMLAHAATLASKLSGGQQKRLSVAIELLRQPRLLLLDEPTSGLDPGLQGRVMDLLRSLSRRGMTVVCSTHTLDTLNFFDSVVVVGRRHGVGAIGYTGPPTELLPTFGVRNASDLYEKVQHLEQEASAAAPPAAESGLAQPPAAGEDEATTSTATAGATLTSPARPRLERRPFLLQARTVCLRSLKGLGRDRMTLIVTGLQPIILAFLAVLSQHARGGALQVHFFLIVSAVWMGMTLTVREIVRERPLYQRDRLAGLHPDAYIGGRTLAATAPLACQVVLLYLVALGLVDVLFEDHTLLRSGENPREVLLDTSWVRGLLVLLFAALGGLFIGLMISILSRTERAAVSLLPLVILPQVLLSRAISGYAHEAWDEPSPFLPLLELGKYWEETDPGFGGFLLTVLSLPLVSRPAAAALDMGDVSDGVLAAEWAYLLILVAGHGFAAYVLFRMYEGRIQAR